MFSFFKRNKTTTSAASTPSSSTRAPINNNESGTTKVSQNIQNAIERQQASLQQMLDLRRQSQSSEVNDRPTRSDNLHSLSSSIEESVESKNRSLPLSVSEISIKPSTVRTSDSARSQNYDQFRDAKRRSNSIFESIVPRHTFTSINSVSSSESYSPTVAQVASSITEEQCLTFSSSYSEDYNSVYDTMGRGRNRNRHRANSSGHGSTSNTTQQLKSEKSGESDVKVSTENCNVHKRSFSCEDDANESSKRVAKLHENPNKSAHADDEYSEKSASISLCESVFHDENSCSINSSTLEVKNKRDNMTASDVVHDDGDCEDDDGGAMPAASLSADRYEKSENGVKNYVNEVDDDDQQVNGSAPLQRSYSARRVTFAPSPTRSIASSSSDDNETLSEDIFYEAADAPSSSSSESSQKLKILSTMTSQSSDLMIKRIDEESSNETSSHGLNSTGNDVVSGTMILSFDGNDKDKLETAFSDDKSNGGGGTMKTYVKPSYMMVGDETVALPDIVAETSQHQLHNSKPSADEM